MPGIRKQRQTIARKLLKKPRGQFEPIDLIRNPAPSWMTRAYQNNRYVVMIDDNARMTGGIMAIKAMIQRHDDRPIPYHWREMQSIKNELFGSETVAIEYYPAQSRLIDKANIYWLFILPPVSLPLPDLIN